ncbi:MFS transporter [Cohnella faecalis]|uniref:MFS transporter n=1 Tax=Cohnella faecalis TaxID=2315694 RepID=A0A398CQJ8_9BACL|nr:MFS transporter [Cohnella faecalis]RIE03539.1 MFS transporter [Cohnella faecalis]
MAADDKKIVLRIAWITALCLIGDSMLYIVLPLYWKEAGLGSLFEVGLVLSANRLIRIPLNPLIGWLYGRIGIRQGLILSIVIAIATTASYGIAEGFLFWIFARCLWGVAWSFLRLGAYYVIIELRSSNELGRLFGIYNGNYRLGSLFGMLAGGGLAQLYGLRQTALALAVFAFCGIAAVYRKGVFEATGGADPIPKRTEARSTISRGIGRRFITGGVIALLLSSFTSSLIYEGMFTSSLSHFTEARHPSTTFLGLSFGSALLAGGLQALRWGWGPALSPFIGALSDRNGSAVPMIVAISLFASGLFLLFPMSLPSTLWIVVTIGILLTATGMSTLLDVLAASIASRHPGTERNVMTVYSMTLDLGAALGPVAAFWAIQRTNGATLYWASAILLFSLSASWRFQSVRGAKATPRRS